MKEGKLLNEDCVIYEVPARFVSMPSMHFHEYSGYNVDVGIPRKDGKGKFDLVKENDIVKKALEAGNGVYFKGNVYFSKRKLSESQPYKRFISIYKRSKTNIEKKCSKGSEKFILDHVKEVHQVPIVRSIYQLYVSGLYSSDVLIKKLNVYLAEEHIAELIQLYESEKEAA